MDYQELKNKYKIEDLSVRHKRNDKSKYDKNVNVRVHGIDLRSQAQFRMNNSFSGLIKLHVN